MNLLAISYFLPPNLSAQAIQIGRLLNSIDVNLGVVSAKTTDMPNGLDCYPDFNKRLAFRLEIEFKSLLSGIFHWIATYGIPFYARSPDEYKGWAKVAKKKAIEYLKNSTFVPNAILSFGAPMSDHLVGLHLKRTYKLPWVAHFSDPWSDNSFNRRYFLSNYINRRYESKVILEADMVIFTSIETLDLVMRKYPLNIRSKARVLPHSYEPNLYPHSHKTESGKLVFRYLGSFYGKRTPLPLFKALADIHKKSPFLLKNLTIELIGSVPKRMLYNSEYRSLPIGLIKIENSVTYSRSLNLMSESDLLIVIDAPEEHSVFLPSKLVDYIGAHVPILGIVPPGASAVLINRLGGRVASPIHREEVCASLISAIEESWDRKRSPNVAGWGCESVRSEYRSAQVTGDFYKMIEAAIK
jgi:hypothetical protein